MYDTNDINVYVGNHVLFTDGPLGELTIREGVVRKTSTTMVWVEPTDGADTAEVVLLRRNAVKT
ncbi:hypothetical protein [Saccharopolyspora mangrovi]|uniref:Uncharacterized protein n=1 Tax=Saccharopolyspora mangrovi TaxID=3082379 RepID=A0ABU6A7B7_9PSEU|nr:hypothetical protein [Saccharopolyspora sp. S2-29]MEB3367385.1 hypothetical protein [Saccharopolyspora sp. S2-29]